MIKGAQKQMIVVKTSASRYFEEAYFVLKNDVTTKKRNRTDLLTEANRILKESESTRTRKGKGLPPWICFSIGIVSGASVAAILLLLL